MTVKRGGGRGKGERRRGRGRGGEGRRRGKKEEKREEGREEGRGRRNQKELAWAVTIKELLMLVLTETARGHCCLFDLMETV